MLKIHVGCGPRVIPGWVHVDLMPYPHVSHIVSAEQLSRAFGRGSASVVYASHILEHFHRSAVPHVLLDWYAVLEPNGILRLAVPDFLAIVEHYQATGHLEGIRGLLYGGQDHPLNFHHCAFDEATLAALLTDAGFRDIHRWDWQSTEHATVDDYSQAYLPHMQKSTGRLMSLNLKGMKP